MKIGTKERLFTGVTLVVIGLLGATIWWANEEINSTNRHRRQVSDIARAVSELRLASFEYRLYHHDRARQQWLAASDRLDHAIANVRILDPAQQQILADMRERRRNAKRLFAELTAVAAGSDSDASRDATAQRHETQIFSQLIGYQQANLVGAFRLIDIATRRIDAAQQRALIVILTGLSLLATMKIGSSWLINRDLIGPVVQLQQVTKKVAAGDWSHSLGIRRTDEIGELSKNFDSMTNALRESFSQIEHNNRSLAALNEELNAFSYSVSHDLRGPLRSMDGFALALIEDHGDKLDDEGKDALERIRAASQRMGDLIDDLLRLSKVTRAELKVKRLDLGVIARAIADHIDRERIGRPVEWVIDTGLNLRADPGLMQIAMQNLLWNAAKFTGKTERPVIRIGVLERDVNPVYFIADNGVGFDMAHADHLFEAFQRLHDIGEFPGTGIGLAIVRRIIRRHGGDIWVEAKEGEGATFFFRVKEPEHGSNEQNSPAG